MALEIRFFSLSVELFSPNMGTESDGHGERIHQEIKEIKKLYQDILTTNMMANYYWVSAVRKWHTA